MKLCLLVPCLMTENNREVNFKKMEEMKTLGVDEIIVNDQCFKPSDYQPGFTYIGKGQGKAGFVGARNQLLNWFYDSDYDWAVWLDANASVSKTTKNDFLTIIENVKAGNIKIDCIFSTLGIMISTERMEAHQYCDYFENVSLLHFTKSRYSWMHGLFMKNFNKFYNVKPVIDERCDPYVGTSEDVYFAKLLRRLFDYRVAATVTISKPHSKHSTWQSGAGSYDYAPIDYEKIDDYIVENLYKYPVKTFQTSNVIKLERIDKYKEYLKPYQSRSKKKQSELKIERRQLF